MKKVKPPKKLRQDLRITQKFLDTAVCIREVSHHDIHIGKIVTHVFFGHYLSTMNLLQVSVWFTRGSIYKDVATLLELVETDKPETAVELAIFRYVARSKNGIHLCK